MTAMPGWLRPLVEAVASNMTVHSPHGEVGIRLRRVEDCWDVLLYPRPVEMVGGAHDGGKATPGFRLELQEVLPLFTRVDALAWDAHGSCPEDAETGPCVSVRGTLAGHKLWVRLLAFAPADVEVVARVDGTGRRQAG